MYEILKGRIFCPACMKLTEHEIQVKAFDGSMKTYDIRAPPFELLGKYAGYRTYGTRKIESYSKWYDTRERRWEMQIDGYGECSECHTHWSGHIAYTRKGVSKPPYGPWKLFCVLMKDVWADSLVGARMHDRKRAGEYRNILLTSDLNYLFDLSKIGWKKSDCGDMKFFVDDRKHRYRE